MDRCQNLIVFRRTFIYLQEATNNSLPAKERERERETPYFTGRKRVCYVPALSDLQRLALRVFFATIMQKGDGRMAALVYTVAGL